MSAPRHHPASSSANAAAGGPSLPVTESLLLIVVGSSIAAELRDRPLAYRLREHVLDRLETREQEFGDAAPPLVPVVCTDLWYLNATEADGRPAITLGDPNVNAATALFSNRLPTAFVIEGSLRVHIDLEFLDLRAAIWGISAAATASAIDLFLERYLDEFLSAAGI